MKPALAPPPGPLDEARRRSRRKADLLAASMLVREQGVLALDELQQTTERWEARAQRVRDLGRAWVDRWVPAAVRPWAAPVAAGALALWLGRRRRRVPAAVRRAHGEAGQPVAPGWSVWALLGLAAARGPRILRWLRHGRRAWWVLQQIRPRAGRDRRPRPG